MSLSYDFQRRSWESDWRSWGVDWSISEINMCMLRSLKYSNVCARCYLDNLLYIQHFFTISYHPGCPSVLIGCRWWFGIIGLSFTFFYYRSPFWRFVTSDTSVVLLGTLFCPPATFHLWRHKARVITAYQYEFRANNSSFWHGFWYLCACRESLHVCLSSWCCYVIWCRHYNSCCYFICRCRYFDWCYHFSLVSLFQFQSMMSLY